MKKSLLALVLSGLAIAPAFADKVGIVDLDAVKQKYAKALDSEKTLNGALQDAKGELDRKVANLKKLQAEGEAIVKDVDNPTLNDAARTAKKEEARKKAEEFRKAQMEVEQFQQQAGGIFQQRAQQRDHDIIADVRTKAAVIAKEKGLDVVLPKGVVLYSADALDISEDVVKRLNEAYAANPVNPTAAPAPAAPATPAAK